jgi:hypothetical protein
VKCVLKSVQTCTYYLNFIDFDECVRKWREFEFLFLSNAQNVYLPVLVNIACFCPAAAIVHIFRRNLKDKRTIHLTIILPNFIQLSECVCECQAFEVCSNSKIYVELLEFGIELKNLWKSEI